MPARNANHWTQKPPPGTPLDLAHPLGPGRGLVACYLFNEGTGNPYDPVSGNTLTTFSTGFPVWGFGPLGAELVQNGGTGGFRSATAPITGMPLTIGCIGRALTGNNGAYREAFGVYDSGPSATFSVGWSGTSGTPSSNCGTNNLASGTALGVGVPATLAATFQDTSTKTRLFVNGVFRASSGSNATAVTPSRVWVSGSGSAANLAVTMGVMWNRVLGDQEIAAWSADPYGLFLTPPAPRRWFVAPAAPAGVPPYPWFQFPLFESYQYEE